MVDNIDFNTRSIHRNSLDVATELTQYYIRTYEIKSIPEIQEVFAQFYAIAEAMDHININDLADYLPEKLKDVAKALY